MSFLEENWRFKITFSNLSLRALCLGTIWPLRFIDKPWSSSVWFFRHGCLYTSLGWQSHWLKQYLIYKAINCVIAVYYFLTLGIRKHCLTDQVATRFLTYSCFSPYEIRAINDDTSLSVSWTQRSPYTLNTVLIRHLPSHTSHWTSYSYRQRRCCTTNCPQTSGCLSNRGDSFVKTENSDSNTYQNYTRVEYCH